MPSVIWVLFIFLVWCLSTSSNPQLLVPLVAVRWLPAVAGWHPALFRATWSKRLLVLYSTTRQTSSNSLVHAGLVLTIREPVTGKVEEWVTTTGVDRWSGEEEFWGADLNVFFLWAEYSQHRSQYVGLCEFYWEFIYLNQESYTSPIAYEPSFFFICLLINPPHCWDWSNSQCSAVQHHSPPSSSGGMWLHPRRREDGASAKLHLYSLYLAGVPKEIKVK